MSTLKKFILPALLLVTFLVFAGVMESDYIALDDPMTVLENPALLHGLTFSSIASTFTDTSTHLWMPVTLLSLLFETALFGFDPRWMHLDNLLLHLANVALLFCLLRRATGSVWRSFTVAAVFALHPLQVESVAWVTERKNVLSTLFWFLALHGWVSWQKNRRKRDYILVLVLGALGLMSKPILMTLPGTLLLLDFWPGKRFSHEKINCLLWEKIPFAILSLATAVVTLLVNRGPDGAYTLATLGIFDRLSLSAVSYVLYLRQMVWPASLSLLYRLPIPPAAGPVLISVGVLASVTMGIWFCRKKWPSMSWGWAWFLMTLLPVIGLVPVGSEASADRFCYVPIIGIAVAVVWPLAGPQGKWPKTFLALGVVTFFSWLTVRQVALWENSVTLFSHSVALSPGNAKAQSNLGFVLAQEGRRAEAIEHYRAALQIDPALAETWRNLGAALSRLERDDEATLCFLTAARLQADDPLAPYNLGTIQEKRGKTQLAMSAFAESARRNPQFAPPHYRMGVLLEKNGQLDAALTHFQICLILQPDNQQARLSIEQIGKK